MANPATDSRELTYEAAVFLYRAGHVIRVTYDDNSWLRVKDNGVQAQWDFTNTGNWHGSGRNDGTFYFRCPDGGATRLELDSDVSG